MRIRHDHLKRLRVQAGWTQEEVGARCKIDVRTYRKYERGEVNKGLSGLEEFNRSDQYDVLDRIAACFGLTSPDELIERDAQTQSAELPPGPGSTYHLSWYVHRDAEERKATNRLRGAGAPVVLQGPWLHGKATLLSHLLQRATADCTPDTPRVVHVNLFDLDDTSFQSLDSLLRTLGQRILATAAPNQDGQEPDAGSAQRSGAPSVGSAQRDQERSRAPSVDEILDDIWKSPASEKQKLTTLLKRHVLLPKQRLFLALERADRLQGLPFMHDLFALLRGWAEMGLEDPFSRLRLLVTVATEPTLLEDTDHSSFFAMANPIRVESMDRTQLAQLALLHQLRPSGPALDRLMELLHGHPYLLRLALYEVMTSEVTLEHVLDAVDWTGGVFQQHLSHLRNWVRQTGLLPAIGQVLHGQSLPFLEYCKLYSKGLVVERARGVYTMRCRLYEDYFRALLSSSAQSPPGAGRGGGSPGQP